MMPEMGRLTQEEKGGSTDVDEVAAESILRSIVVPWVELLGTG